MSHSDKAALRGEPSYVWRSGQKRRLQMVAQYAQLDRARVLDAGGGNGMYASQIARQYEPAQVELFDIEWERVQEAGKNGVAHGLVSAGEYLPYRTGSMDTVISNEVIEHVADDQQAIAEMVRVLKIGGHLVIFCPNRWYPVEQHGHYWNDTYHFGNTPLINYLPDRWRNQLAPHVRAYTRHGLRRLFADLPVEIVHHSRIYGGYDNLVPRLGKPMVWFREFLYTLEGTVFDTWALSHFIVVRKHSES